MWVAELWRFPVKSMAGERLESIELSEEGLTGDRLVYIVDRSGRVVTSRTKPRLLGHRGTIGADGEPLVDGRPWRSPEVAADVVRAAGPGTRLVPAAVGRFDKLPLLVATDGAIAAFGYDGRRLRPNLVIGGVTGLAERGWEGGRLAIGEVEIWLVDLRGRCVMTTFDPDTQVQDPAVLRKIVREFDGTLALNAAVVRGGRVALGDTVELRRD
jgi:MOSC domain-containing protein